MKKLALMALVVFGLGAELLACGCRTNATAANKQTTTTAKRG